ncbi:TetR family transcriptional regulator [Zavarzinia compransoris]|nr:TetR family transcriptional regulator [Zavarzinia compransoris]
MPPAPSPRASSPKARTTQAERRSATRAKIIEATLACLADQGFAATGVAQVVTRAGVSRGAWAHHFPTMEALILATAEHLLTAVHDRLDQIVAALSGGDQAVETMVAAAWGEFFSGEVNEIYLELLVASRRNPALAAVLHDLSERIMAKLATVAAARFVPAPGAVGSVTETLMLGRWLMRGMALDAHMLPPDLLGHYLGLWRRLASTQMNGR